LLPQWHRAGPAVCLAARVAGRREPVAQVAHSQTSSNNNILALDCEYSRALIFENPSHSCGDVQLFSGNKFSQVLGIVTLNSEYSRALTFENLCQDARTTSAPLTVTLRSARPCTCVSVYAHPHASKHIYTHTNTHTQRTAP